MLKRLGFVLLNLTIIAVVVASLMPRSSRADTVTASESFSSTTYIDTTNTTASVDTVHTQVRLTNTDSWSVRAGGILSTTNINDVGMASTTVGWAVGASGKIYTTPDGGLTWFPQTSGVSVTLNAISVVNANTVYVAGASGTILKTTNGGSTWAAQTSGTANALNDIIATSTTAAWAVGASGTIVATTNGATWAAQTSGTANNLNAIAAVSATAIWAVGNSATILVSANGTTWSSQTATGATANFLDVAAQDISNLFLVGAGGVIYLTLNGGATWNSVTSPTTSDIVAIGRITGTNTFLIADSVGNLVQCTSLCSLTSNQSSSQNGISLNGIAMPSSTAGVIVGNSGVIIRTTDGSLWKSVNGNGEYAFRAVALDSNGAFGWALGVSDAGATGFFGATGMGFSGVAGWTNKGTSASAMRGIAVRTNGDAYAVGDGGAIATLSGSGFGAVTARTSGTANQLNAVATDGISNAWAVGNSGTIRVTTDGGVTWSGLTSGTSSNLNAIVYDSTQSIVYIVGDGGTLLSASTGAIATLSTGISTNINAISRGGTTLWAAGASNTIIRSTDNGATWSSLTSGLASTVTFLGITATSSSTAYAITSTTVIKTTDSGATWTNITPGGMTDEHTLTSVAAYGYTVVLVGNHTLTFSSTNAGTSWTTASDAAMPWLRAASCASSTTCWTFGHNGTILTSSDSGSTWTTQTSGTTNRLLGGAMASATVGWAVGDSGTILKTADGATWATQTSGTSNRLRAVNAPSTSVAWAVGDSGTILATTNGGTSWSAQTSGVTTQLNAVSAPSTSVAWAAGASGTVLLTTDSGATWTAKTTGVATTLNGIYSVDSSTGYVVGASGTVLKTTNGGSTWTTLTSGTAANLFGIAALDSSTLRVSGAGVILQSTNAGGTWSSIATSDVSSSITYHVATHPAINAGIIAGRDGTIIRYIPVYSATSQNVVSNNVNTTATNIASATLTATSTLNSQTAAYALSNDGGTTFSTVTSGSPYTFGTTGADLRWRATLSSTDTSTTPLLTQISLSAETATPVPPSRRDEPPIYVPPPKDPFPNPEAAPPTMLSPTAIRWNFLQYVDGDGVKLLRSMDNKTYTEIRRVVEGDLTFIDETGLTPNGVIANRAIQSLGRADWPASTNPTPLPTVTLPPQVPPTPGLVKFDDSTTTLRILDGGNAPPITFALHESTTDRWLGNSRSFTATTPVWKTTTEWNDTPEEALRIVGLTANTTYAIRIKARGLKDVETDSSQSLGFTTALEVPATIVPTKKKETELAITVKSVKEDGTFTNLPAGSSGILIENVTTGESSGWLKVASWTAKDLKPATTYEFRVKTRTNDGMESPPSPIISIATVGKKEAPKEPEIPIKEEPKEPETPAEEPPTVGEGPLPPPSRRQEEPPLSPQPPPAPPTTFLPVSGSGGAPLEAPVPQFAATTRLQTPRVTKINGIALDPTQPPPRLSIDPRQTPELILNGTSEPNVVVEVIIASEPFIAATRSDVEGKWELRIATALIPTATEHTVSIRTRTQDTISPQLVIATLTITQPALEQTTQTIVNAAAAAAEGAIKIAEKTVTITKEVMKVTREAAKATQETVKRVEPETQIVLTTVVPIVVATNPPLWLLLPRLPLLIWNLIIWLLQLLGVRKRRLPWGVVYDSITKEPLALAVVRVFDANTNRIVETQVTDRAGRFGVMLMGGSFRLEVTKGGYIFPTKIVATAEDGPWSNVYRGGPTSLAKDTAVVTVAIPIDPIEEKRPSAEQRLASTLFELRHAFRRIAPSLTWTGTAAGWILTAASPTSFNITIGVVYLAVALLDALARPKTLRPWGRVLDASSGAPIALVTVDLIDLKYNKLLRSRLTDRNGRFAFFPPPGNYRLQARKEGFTMPTQPKPLPKMKNPYFGTMITITKKMPTVSVNIPVEATKEIPPTEQDAPHENAGPDEPEKQEKGTT